MEFMSDEEFNRVMDEFDWDAPINETQGEQKLPESCSQSTAETSQIPPFPMTPDSSHGPCTSEPVARVKTPEDPFGPVISADYTKRKPTNDLYVLPAEIYYDPKHCIFWDDRDFDWTRPPRLSGYRQPRPHQDNIEPSASSTKDPNQTEPIESESGGTDLSLPSDIRPSTPNPSRAFQPMDIQSSINRPETSPERLERQGNEMNPDMTASKDHPSATEQCNYDTTNANVSEDLTNATEQDDGIITNTLASIDHASPLQQGGRITANVDISKDCDRPIDQDCEVITNVPALKDHVHSTPQNHGIIIDGTVSSDCEVTADKSNETITGMPASTDHASPLDQSNGVTDKVDVSQDFGREIDQDGENISDALALKIRVELIEQAEGINTNASVSKDFESIVDQGLSNGQHEARVLDTMVSQDSTEMEGIEKTSTVDWTKTRLMAVAPKRTQRLFSSAVSLSSIPVRGSVKTRKTVNPFATWQPPQSGTIPDFPDSQTGIPQDIGETSNIGRQIGTPPASTSLSNLVSPSEGASKVQSSSASYLPTLRESSAHLPANTRSTYCPPAVDAPPLANEIGKSLVVPLESQAISTIDASASVEHPVEAVDLTRSTSTRSGSKDEEASLSQLEVEDHGEQSLCDETYCSTEQHAASPEAVIDLAQVSSTSEAFPPTIEFSHTPEANHEALLSPITNTRVVKYFTKPEAVPEAVSVSGTDVELPQKPSHDAQTSCAPVAFANIDPRFDAPEAVHEAIPHSEGSLAHPIRPRGTLGEAQSLSALEVPVPTGDAVDPPNSVRRTQSSFVQFVCTPTEEPVTSLEAAEVEEAQPSPIAEASIPVHDHVDHLRTSHEGQELPPPNADLITEKHVEIADVAHECSDALTVRSSETTEDSAASITEAAQEVMEDRAGPDEVSLVESNSGSMKLLEPYQPQLKVIVPSPGETLTPPDSRRSSLRSRTPLKQSFQEPVSSLQEPTASMEEPGRITGNLDATVAKLDRTAPRTTPKDKGRGRSASSTDRSTRSNTKETSTHPKSSILPAQTAQLADGNSALQVKQAEALPGGDDISSMTQLQAKGNDTRLIGPENASQAELSSEYYDELAMSDPKDSCCTPLAVQLTPQRKHQVHNSKSSPSLKSGRRRKETQSTDTALSIKARKRAKTGPQGRKLVGDRELGGLLMRQDTPDTKMRRMDGKTEVKKLFKKAIDEVESSNGKSTEIAPEKGVRKAGSEKTSSRKRGRNKSLDLTSDKKVIEKKPRRSERLSDGVDTTEDVQVAKNDKPRRSGRLVDGTMK